MKTPLLAPRSDRALPDLVSAAGRRTRDMDERHVWRREKRVRSPTRPHGSRALCQRLNSLAPTAR